MGFFVKNQISHAYFSVPFNLFKHYYKERIGMKSGRIEDFKHLSKFRDTKDFNNHIEQWMIDIKDQFTKSELVALKRLIRYACKFAGVSNAKIQTIVAATHKDTIGISRSTFERMLRKAKKLGIVKIQNTKRGSFQGHNVYTFLPYPSKEEVVKESNLKEVDNPENIEGAIKTTILSKTNNQHLNKRKEPIDSTFTNESVPKTFKNLAKCFFDDANTIESFWNRVQIVAWRNSCEQNTDQVLDVAIVSFKQLIGKMKRSRVRDAFGYFYGILDKKFNNLFYDELFKLAIQNRG